MYNVVKKCLKRQVHQQAAFLHQKRFARFQEGVLIKEYPTIMVLFGSTVLDLQ